MTADEVRRLRRLTGKTQAEFASLLRVQRNTVVRWENNRHPVSPSMAELIGMKVSDFLSQSSEPISA